MKNNKLKIGLIGFGAWTRSAYLDALRYDGRAVISAVTAASEKTRKLAQELAGDGAVIYKDYKTLLKQSEVDAVMIAVPDEVHQTVLTAAVDSGIPFLYEPPIAIYRDQIPVMIDLLLKAKQITYADLELGCHPAVTRIIQIIKNGLIGNLHNVTITLHSNFGHSESDLCLINRMSCWYIDVLNRITGTIPKRVLTLDGYGNSGRMQTISMGIYDYNGIWGEFKANINSTKELSISLEINGDEGMIDFDYFSGEIRYRSLQQKEWLIESYPSLLPYADYPGVRESVSSFLTAVECGITSMGNAQMVAQLNQIGMAADESKDTGNWAEVKVLTSTK